MKKDFNKKRVQESTSPLTILEELDTLKSHFHNKKTMYQPIQISQGLQRVLSESGSLGFTLFPDEHALIEVANRNCEEYFLFLK